MNDTQEVLALNKRAVKEGTLRWEIPNSPCNQFQFEPVVIRQEGVAVGYILPLSLDEARMIQPYRLLVAATDHFYPEADRSVTLFVAQVYVISEARKFGLYRKSFESFTAIVGKKGYKHMVGGIKKSNERSLMVHTSKAGLGWKILHELGEGPETWLLVSKDI